MTKKIGSTRISLLSVTLLAATFVFSPCAPSAAQSAISTDFSAQQQQEKKGQQKKAAPSARPAPQRAAPQRAAPHVAASQRTAPRTVTQTRTQSHVVRQPTATTRSVTAAKGNLPRRHTAEDYDSYGQAAEDNQESGHPNGYRSQESIAGCRSAGRHTKRNEIRHCGPLARGSGARRRPRCHPRPKLLGLAQRLSHTSWRRLADVCCAQRIGRDCNRLKSILPIRLHFGTPAIL